MTPPLPVLTIYFSLRAIFLKLYTMPTNPIDKRDPYRNATSNPRNQLSEEEMHLPPEQITFGDLPFEIREQIFLEYVRDVLTENPNTELYCLPLMRTNRQCNREVAKVIRPLPDTANRR